MKNEVIITIKPAEDCNPEFAPEQELQDGEKCSGYLLFTFDEDGNIHITSMYGVSVQMLADAITFNEYDGAMPVLRSAAELARGQIEAIRIEHAAEAHRAIEQIKGGPFGGKVQILPIKLVNDEEEDE